MTEHDAREAQTPEERAKETLAALRSQYKIWGSPIVEAELTRSIREAADAAHAAGKAEGAADERATATCETQMTSGMARIAAERKRQIEEEGWTPEHDDTHANGELAGAAACYAVSHIAHWAAASVIARVWPWEPEWWKRNDDPIRDLEKAGALIAAEIDRRIRARTEGGEGDG